ncbi:reticulon isoform X1 [Megalopta genalis]|uniref:reticulon isoform X1 n=1 Tax=Megalopta genalis TaxID=115081 RepID=UPI003FCF608A
MAELKEQPIRREHDSMDDFEHLENVQDGQPGLLEGHVEKTQSALEPNTNAETDMISFSPNQSLSNPEDPKNATTLLLEAEKVRPVEENKFEVRSKEPEPRPAHSLTDPTEVPLIEPIPVKNDDELMNVPAARPKEEIKDPVAETNNKVTPQSVSHEPEILSVPEKKPEPVPVKPEPVSTKPDSIPETLQSRSNDEKKLDTAKETSFVLRKDKKERTDAPETDELELELEIEATLMKCSKPEKQEARKEAADELLSFTAPKEKFPRIGIDAWFNPERLDPKVADLIYWRDPKKTGPVFGAILCVLLSLVFFSLISVLAYISFFVLTGNVLFRIYKTVFQAIQKTSDGHPFKDILEMDLTVPAEKVHEVADVAVAHANAAVNELRRLFLVEDFVDSLKFGVILWCLTYVGSWFNGLTLLILEVVSLFTLPKVYETNKAQIDQNLALVYGNINELTARVRAAIPLGKKEPVKEE